METFYKCFFENPIMAIANHSIVVDREGIPVDYIFLDVNNAFERFTGLKKDKIIGKSVRQAIPGIEKSNFDWIGKYGKIALKGGDISFEQYDEKLKRWYKVYAFSTEKMKFTTIFSDISIEKTKENELERFFSVSPDLFCIVNLDGVFLKVNPAWYNSLGYYEEELINKKLIDFLHPDDIDITLEEISGLAKGKETFAFVNRYKNKSGRFSWFEWKAQSKGNVIYAAARDITDFKEAEKKLIKNLRFQEITAEFSSKFINSTVDTIDQDINDLLSRVGKFFGVDRSYLFKLSDDYEIMSNTHEWTSNQKLSEKNNLQNLRLNDFPWWKKQLLNKNYIHIPNIERLPDSLDAEKTMLRKQSIKSLICIPIKSDTKIHGFFGFDSVQRSYKWEKNEIKHIRVISDIIVNVLTKLDYEVQILKSEKKLDSLISNSPVAIYSYQFDKELVPCINYISDNIKTILGYEPNKFINNFDFFIENIHPEDAQRRFDDVIKLISEGESHLGEYRFKNNKGEYLWIEDRQELFTYSDGSKEVIGACWDISKRKLAEEKLKQKEEDLLQITENMSEVLWLRNKDNNKVLYVSSAYEKIWGRSCQSLYDNPSSFLDSVYEPDKQLVINNYKKYIRTGIFNLEYRIVVKDGGIKWVRTKSYPVKDDDGKIIRHVGLAIDISESKKYNEYLKLLIEISKEFINLPAESLSAELNRALKLIGQFVNADRAYIFEYKWGEQICTNTFEWCEEGISPEIDNLQEVPLSLLPWWVEKHKKGKTLTIKDVNSLDINDGVRQVLEPQGVLSLMTLPLMQGNECVGFIGFDSVKKHHIYTEDEESILTVFSKVLENLFSRVALEKSLIREKENALSANIAKTQFLSKMSHEIRTPLNGIIGFTDLLKNTPLSEVQKQYLQNANVSGRTLLEIINNILDFSKIEAGKLLLEPEKTDIIKLVEDSIDIIKYLAHKNKIELLLNLDKSMPRYVVADGLRLKQILANLLSNAVKFTNEGEVELKVKFEQIGKNKGKFLFSVRDTGMGISDHQKKNLFKEFSQIDNSLNRKFGGTGLGLVISDMIAKEMGSKIMVNSRIGEGSVFYFDIIAPIKENIVEEAPIFTKISHCLIVDDNESVCKVLKYVLSSLGISCHISHSGLAAIDILNENKSFDLIICDYDMPDFNGLRTVKAIREVSDLDIENIPIIMMHSSYDASNIYSELDTLGVKYRLSKPVKRSELFSLLNTIQNPEKFSYKSKSDFYSPVDIKEEGLPDKTINVMIVEDVDLNVIVFKSMLENIIHNVSFVEAVNGLEAVDLFKSDIPDIIFMDVQMPEMNGLDATREIRNIELRTDKHVPIIALTAGAFAEDREKCISAGMDDFLPKPIDINKLKDILKKYLPNYVNLDLKS